MSQYDDGPGANFAMQPNRGLWRWPGRWPTEEKKEKRKKQETKKDNKKMVRGSEDRVWGAVWWLEEDWVWCGLCGWGG